MNAQTEISKADVPAIGEIWPGTTAVYAGKSLSQDGERVIHLIVWPDEDSKSHAKGVSWAEKVNPEIQSHLPTDHQAITMRNNVANIFRKYGWYWTLTKTKSEKSAFVQDFGGGTTNFYYLNGECRVRAVSEIPL